MAEPMNGPLIVTAELSPADFAYFEALRRKHFPPERNHIPAHLTMFHALPPSSEPEVRRQLGRFSTMPPPAAQVAGLMNLGGGVAFRLVSAELDGIRDELAGRLHGLLTAQDAQGWRPHITVQNKVSTSEARRLLADLERSFRPRPLQIAAIGLHRYLGGPWEKLARYSFRGV